MAYIFAQAMIEFNDLCRNFICLKQNESLPHSFCRDVQSHLTDTNFYCRNPLLLAVGMATC